MTTSKSLSNPLSKVAVANKATNSIPKSLSTTAIEGEKNETEEEEDVWVDETTEDVNNKTAVKKGDSVEDPAPVSEDGDNPDEATDANMEDDATGELG